MPLMMTLTFDNSDRFDRRVQYFQYGGVRFKLVQNNPRRWSDVLLSIVPLNDAIAAQRVYSAAGEWASALSWENGSAVAIQNAGGYGVREGTTLRNGSCRVFAFPQVPFSGHSLGYSLTTLPHVETDSQRIAL